MRERSSGFGIRGSRDSFLSDSRAPMRGKERVGLGRVIVPPNPSRSGQGMPTQAQPDA